MTELKKELMAKGPLLIPLALIINNTKHLNWTQGTDLSEADVKLIRKGILSSQWYERSLMERMALAVFKLVGKELPESAFQFGYGVMCETLLKIYRSPLTSNDPREIISKFANFYSGTWFNTGKAEFTPEGKGGVFKIEDPDGIPCPKAFVPMMRGVFSRLVKENGGQNVKVVAVEEPLVSKKKIYTLTLNMSWE